MTSETAKRLYHDVTMVQPQLPDNENRSREVLARPRERTPHDCPMGIRAAWRGGEPLKHPCVAGALDSPTPESARIYRHSDEWGVVFVVIKDQAADAGTAPDRTERIVVTVCRIRTYDSGPVRAYLHGHGPHGPAEER